MACVMMSRITTVIPAYNREHLIGETLRSVLSQTRAANEIIVVDDGSTDGTAEAVKQFGKDVRLIRQLNQGAGAARNRGLAEATGEFIHFMDSDDLSSLNTYECQLDAIRKSGADVAYGPWVKTRFENENCTTQPVVLQQKPLPSCVPLNEWVLRGWVTVFQPCLFRRSILEKAGSYREDLKPSEDTEYLYRIGSVGAKLIHTPDTLVVYRVHPEGQISSVNTHARQSDWLRLLSVLESHCRQDKSVTPYTRRLFDIRKIASLRAIGNNSDQTLTNELWSTVSLSSLVLYRLTYAFRRLSARMRRLRFGDNYIKPFGVSAIAAEHKRAMLELGFHHVGYF
jgi:glycosyltransferase involved in cell wall biosynthesis